MKTTALAALLSLTLMGCSQVPRQVPPSEWLDPTPAPVREVKVNADLAQLVKDYQAALRSCNADKQDIRDFQGK